jgi:hypothetical protein
MTISDLFASIAPDPQRATMMTALDPCRVVSECLR